MNMKKKICKVLVFMMVLGSIGSVNLSSVAYAEKGDLGEGYDLTLIDREYNSVEGDVVSTESKDIVTILMFGKTDGTCVNSTNMINWFCEKTNWINDERIRFVFVDINKDTPSHMLSLSNKYNCKNARFCYSLDDTAMAQVWKYSDTIQGVSTGFQIPLTVIKDGNNKVQYAFYGSTTPTQIKPYIEDLIGGELLTETGEPAEDTIDFEIEGSFDEEEAMKVLALVNENRVSAGLQPAILDKTLTEKAMQRAAECAVNYGHTRPDGYDWYTILDSWYMNGCAENVAMLYTDAQAAMEGWMNSEGHRNNIMNKYYTSIGIGCFENNGVRYWVQLFSTHSEEEKTEAQNYTKKVTVTAKTGYYGKCYLLYSNGITVGKETITKLELSNKGNIRYGFVPTPDNFSFESADENIVTVDESGNLTGVSAGETTISILYGDKVLGTQKVTVEEDTSSEPSETDKPSVSEPPVTDKPSTSEPPVTDKPSVSEPPATDDPSTSEPPVDDKNIDEETGIEYGDADMNGSITLQDVQMVLKAALGIIEVDEDTTRIMSGGEDKVTLQNAQTVLKIALNIQTAFYE